MVLIVLVCVHVAICVFLVMAVLLQQGKGASAGILSGASQTWFGPAGTKTLLMKVTVGLACAFLLNSVLLVLASNRQTGMLPPPAASQPAAPGSPPPDGAAPSVP